MRENCAPLVSKLVEATFYSRNVVHKGKERKSLLTTYFSLCICLYLYKILLYLNPSWTAFCFILH